MKAGEGLILHVHRGYSICILVKTHMTFGINNLNRVQQKGHHLPLNIQIYSVTQSKFECLVS